MRRGLLWGVVAAVFLCGCTPRFEAWRIDHTDGTSTVVIKRNFRKVDPALWQLDAKTIDLDSGRQLAVADLHTLSDVTLDPKLTDVGDARYPRIYFHRTRESFERWLLASFGAKPYKGIKYHERASYLGTFCFLRSDKAILADLHEVRPDGTPGVIYDIIGKIDCTALHVP